MTLSSTVLKKQISSGLEQPGQSCRYRLLRVSCSGLRLSQRTFLPGPASTILCSRHKDNGGTYHFACTCLPHPRRQQTRRHRRPHHRRTRVSVPMPLEQSLILSNSRLRSKCYRLPFLLSFLQLPHRQLPLLGSLLSAMGSMPKLSAQHYMVFCRRSSHLGVLPF